VHIVKKLQSPSEIANMATSEAPRRLPENLRTANIYFTGMQSDVVEFPTLMCEEFLHLKRQLADLLSPIQSGPMEPADVPFIQIYYDAWVELLSQPNEPNYRSRLCSFMQKLLEAAGYPMLVDEETPVALGSQRKCDLTIAENRKSFPLVLIEAKVLLGATNCNPEVQVASCYAHFVRSQHGEYNQSQVIVEPCPTLLWTCCGEHIKIMCGYTIVRNCKLFHTIETLGSFSMTNDYVRVGKIFRRLICAMNALHEFRSRGTFNAMCPPPIDATSLVKSIAGKLVYHCNDAYYKFARTYCVVAHNYAHELGIAPRLQEWKLMEHGYYFLKMDVVETVEEQWNQEHWEAFQSKMEEFHQTYVHGDIRAPNVLHTASGYMLIDFDWAGQNDQLPRYPLSRNHADINWPEDSTAGGIITTAHDRWMMKEFERVQNTS